MNCVICSLDSLADALMWTCIGCSCTFHAACAGVTVQRNSLRKKEKKTDPTSYVLPCCSACQPLVSLNFDIKALVEQQAKLAELVNANTEITHRINQNNSVQVVDEVIERCEALLVEAKKELTTVNATSASGNIATFKSHITSVVESGLQKSKENLSSMTSAICENLKSLTADINKLSSVTMSIAEKSSSAPINTNPIFGFDLRDEFRKIEKSILSLSEERSTPSTSSCPSLEAELNSASVQTKVDVSVQTTVDASGWRTLGSRKVWKADWTDYDARQLRRKHQQKLADKSKKRNKKTRRNNSASKCNSCKNCNRNNDINNNKGKTNNFIKNNNGKRNCNHRKDDEVQNNNSCCPSSRRTEHAACSSLPSDKDLLAAAKDTFSRPPAAEKRGIQFQRGETINPYRSEQQPSQNPSTSSNWTLRPALRNSFTNHCASCSCERTGFQKI